MEDVDCGNAEEVMRLGRVDNTDVNERLFDHPRVKAALKALNKRIVSSVIYAFEYFDTETGIERHQP
jgi:hypothetical protein